MDKRNNYGLVKPEENLFRSLFNGQFNLEDWLKPSVRFNDWGMLSTPSFKIEGFLDKGDTYELNLELPVVGDSVSVEVEDNTLTVSYNEKKENFSSKGSYSFSIPEDVELSTMEANVGVVNDNTLTVVVKKKETPKKGNIKINIK